MRYTGKDIWSLLYLEVLSCFINNRNAMNNCIIMLWKLYDDFIVTAIEIIKKRRQEPRQQHLKITMRQVGWLVLYLEGIQQSRTDTYLCSKTWIIKDMEKFINSKAITQRKMRNISKDNQQWQVIVTDTVISPKARPRHAWSSHAYIWCILLFHNGFRGAEQ